MRMRLLAGTAAAALAALPATADDPTRRGFDLDPARPALSLDGGFAVETAAAAPRGTFGAAALVDVASGLLTLHLGGEKDQVLRQRMTLQLLGGWSLGWIELSANLPIVQYQNADFSFLEDRGVTGALVDPVAKTALGDLRLGAKVPVLDASSWPLGLAAMLDLRLPTGDGDAFTSDGLAVVPSAVATRAFGPVRVDAQLGYEFRRAGQYAQLVVHDGLTWAAGASADLPPLGPVRRWRAIGELTGGWPRGYDLSGDRYRAPLAARAGLRWFPSGDFAVEAGGGAGLGEAGYGREAWRVFLGVRWARAPAPATDDDLDHDGVANAIDRCPETPGPAALEGCPDRDGDGIPDIDDKCPDEPGPVQNDGCPNPPNEPLVEIQTERLSLKDAIHFDTAKDTIQTESFRILDEVAGLLRQHAEIGKVRIEGHTDNVGTAAYNRDLSKRRAASVVRYLVEKGGIARERLEASGYGFDRPVASNATATGRARNRRVEFTIIQER